MEQMTALFCKDFICSLGKEKNHANTRGCNISTQNSLLSYVNVGENSAKRSKMSTDTSNKLFYVL